MSTTSLGGLHLLGQPNDTFLQKDPSNVYYPQANQNGPYTVLGPVMLPQIYGKDLNTLEIGSSGSINLSIRDTNALEIDASTGISVGNHVYNTIDIKMTDNGSNQAIRFVSGTEANKIQLDDVLLSESNLNGQIWNVLETSNAGIIINNGLVINGGLELGDDIAASNVLISNNLTVGGFVEIGSNLSVGGTVDVNGTVTLNSNLVVSDTANFASNVYIDGSIFRIPAGPEAERPDATEAPFGSIYFNSNTNRFEGLHSDEKWRAFGGVADLDEDTYISAEIDALDEDILRFYANSATATDVRMALSSNLLDIRVDVLLNSNMTVNGASVLESTLSVGGVVTLSDELDVTGVTHLNSNLNVMGMTEMIGDVSMSNALHVIGETVLSSTLSVSDSVTFSSNLSVTETVQFLSTLDVQSTTTLNSNVEVVGAVNMQNNLSVAQVATIHRLRVTENTLLEGTLEVQDMFIANSNVLVHGPATMSNTLQVEDVSTFNAAVIMNSTLSVADSVVFTSNLTGYGDVMLQETLSVAKTVTMNSNLHVEKATTLSSTLTVADVTTLNSNLVANFPSTLNSNLTVNAPSTFNEPVTLNDDLYIEPTETLFVNNVHTHTGDVLNMYMGTSVNGTDYTGTLKLFGNFEVTGTFDSIHTTTTDLFVEDKIIMLATSSNATYGGSNYSVGLDSMNNSVSGIQVQGLPEHFDYESVMTDNSSNAQAFKTSVYNPVYDSSSVNNYDSIWDKSFIWNWNGGLQYGPQSSSKYVQEKFNINPTNAESIASESFWEMKGGGLRLTSYVENDAGELEKISYGIRITKNKELQFVKHEYNAAGVSTNTQQVATFGISF